MRNITVNISGKILTGRAPGQLRQAVRREIETICRQLETEVANKIPIGVAGQAKAGVTHEVTAWNKGRIYEKGPATRYIEVLERGRKKGARMPAPRHLWEWLKRTPKGQTYVESVRQKYFKGAKGKSAIGEARFLRQAAFLKARAIGKYGTKPVRAYHKTYIERKAWAANRIKQAVANFARS